ncbi:class I SAM-dependent methyltransferase [Burkholderiaceae bacterium UC74_6]
MLRWLPWPLPAFVSWALAWIVFVAFVRLGDWTGLLLGMATSGGLAMLQTRRWRRVIVALGFPLSVLILSAAVPAWAWLLPAGLLLLVYPASTWRDAPLFPTPRGALDELPQLAPLPEGARILDLGCGLGHGLRELHRVYPRAELTGIEWSRPLAGACAWLCPWATVERGDMWERDWTGFEMVYVFQRPESMDRVWVKATLELAPGAWLVSLDFEVAGREARARVTLPGGQQLWLYQPAIATQLSESAGSTESPPS